MTIAPFVYLIRISSIMEKWIAQIREFYDGTNKDLLPSVIFGSGRNLLQNLQLQQRIRIGMMPCVSEEHPHTAMGLMTLLAYLLERWGDVRVYRLFFQTDADPQQYEWSIRDSQSTIDDWVFDSLDENAVLYGTLTKTNSTWRWSITLENDLAEEADAENVWAYEANSLAGLVNQLEQVAKDVISQFDVNEIRPIPIPTTNADDTAIARVLRGVFEWQIQLLLVLFGKGWAEGDIQKRLDDLYILGNLTRDDFGAWAVSQAVAHTLNKGYSPVPDSLILLIGADGFIDHFAPHTLYPSMLIGRALFNFGNFAPAIKILDAITETHPDNPYAWLVKADLYRRSGRLAQLLETYHSAIENNVANADLFLQYGQILELIEDNPTNTFVLIDVDDYADYTEQDLIIREAIEAYENVLRLEPDNLTALQNQILLLADGMNEDVDVQRLEKAFSRLLQKDNTGEYIRAVVDVAYTIDDLDPLFDMLEAHAEKYPQRADLRISLAVLAMHLEDYDLASDYLTEAEDLTNDEALLADIDRLMLSVDNPDFEEKLGAIYAVVSGGNKISLQDLKFLEKTIEQAPLLAEAYLYLAQSYMIWGEKDHALDTIKEGYAQLPNHPEVAELLARYEWAEGNKDEAQAVLTDGIAANPTYVPLLARMGQFLFELGEKDAAKGWLTRAEALSPRDPILAEVRKFIADAMSKA